jgi:NAD(P)-dependent dehydrogenase (short-subunit alcohol dehydrogenase family)
VPTALVTGGARRVGRAICLALADAGYDIVVHHRSAGTEAVNAVLGEISCRGRGAASLYADLHGRHGRFDLTAAASGLPDPLTLLVNSASVFEDDRLGSLDPARWSLHFEVNVQAPVMLAQAFAAALPASVADGEACVINVTDQRVLKPNPQFFSYALSKATLAHATPMMAQALAPRIRVNAVAPGPTLASIHQDAEEFAREAAATPLGYGSPPEEIAAAVVYLAGARAVTGQTLAVDGGQHLAWRTPDIVAE